MVEVGAGLGSLTLALAETGADVTAIEVDRGLAAALREVVADVPAVTVVEADAMSLDWAALLGPDDGWVLVANLPYNVATPLVCDLLDGVATIERMLVMVQREVAERLASPPRRPAYGAVSVKVAYWASADVVGVVPASVFVPRPNVESALVEIVRRTPPAVAPEPLFRLVRTAFGQRRKMLRRSLAGLVSTEQFAAAAVSDTARPEELGIDDWVRLTEATMARRDSAPRPGEADDDAPRRRCRAPTGSTSSTPRWSPSTSPTR